MHYKVQVVIVSTEGTAKVLLLQTTKARGEFWQNVTGSIEADECPLKAALREVREETGMIFNDNDLLINLHAPFTYTTTKRVKVEEFTFLLRLPTTPAAIQLDPHEHQNYYWKEVQKVVPEDYGHLSNFEVFQKAKSHI